MIHELQDEGAKEGAVGRHASLTRAPLAAVRLAELVEPESRAHIALVAISANAAGAAGQGWEVVAIASQPRDEAILEAAARLCR